MAMLRAIINYGLYGVEPEFNDATGVLDGMFTQIRYLIAALNHIKRGKCTKDDVCSEIADVLIMCNQLAEIYGRQDVQMRIDNKLKRLRKRCYDMAWEYHDTLEYELKGYNTNKYE